MDFRDPLERELVPRAALAAQRGRPLLSAVRERDGAPDGASTAMLSAFGSVYYVLDQLTTRQTVREMQTGQGESDERVQGMVSTATGHLQKATEWLMRSLEEIIELFGLQKRRQDLISFLQRLSGSFCQPSRELNLAKEQWKIVVCAFLVNAPGAGVHLDAARMAILERNVFQPCGLTSEKFSALAAVFDERRFVGDGAMSGQETGRNGTS